MEATNGMQSDLFDAHLPAFNHSHMVLDPVSSHMFPGSPVQYNNYTQMLAGDMLALAVQDGVLDNAYMANNGYMPYCDILFSTTVPQAGSSLRKHERGTSMSATTVMGHLPPSIAKENVFRINDSSYSGLSSDDLRVRIPSDSCNPVYSSSSTSLECSFGAEDGAFFLSPTKTAAQNQQFNPKLDNNQMMDHVVPSGGTFSMVYPSYHIASSEPKGMFEKSNWNFSSSHSNIAPDNELSLSLASWQVSLTNACHVPDQSSEVGCPRATYSTSGVDNGKQAMESEAYIHALRSSCNDFAFGMKRAEPSNPSPPQGSSSPAHFSQILLGSRFLHITQHIFAEITSYAALEDPDKPDGLGGKSGMPFCSSCSDLSEVPISVPDEIPFSIGESEHENNMDSEMREEASSKKSELLSLLQQVNQRYNHCLNSVQNIVSSFHQATEASISDVYPHFAIDTISSLYKHLREKITHHILLIAHQSTPGFIEENDKAFESSFVKKKWALQQLKKSDQQSWRPQRGLPEKSVSILRQWMFENFLRPYPKDNEKQLLALKSGLTRSQVSNWFINARVRLWKPMIEEMSMELNKKSHADGSLAGERSSRSNNSQMLPVNQDM